MAIQKIRKHAVHRTVDDAAIERLHGGTIKDVSVELLGEQIISLRFTLSDGADVTISPMRNEIGGMGYIKLNTSL
jgi:hypothetical protein